MDLLYSGKVNGFCIVSSDVDFNKLAKRLRESGNLVIGIGEIGRRINNMFSDFDVRNYNYTKLSELLKEFDNLSLSNKENKCWVTHNFL